MDRPSFVQTYLSMCYLIAQRSHDSQTKIGSVLTDEDNVVCSTGYNGFAGKINDEGLPTVRPDKYAYMIHSEESTILNCKHRPVNGIMYINAAPCFKCVQRMWQFGIRKIIYCGLTRPNCIDKEDIARTQDFILRTGNKLSITSVEFDRSLIENVCNLIVSQERIGV